MTTLPFFLVSIGFQFFTAATIQDRHLSTRDFFPKPPHPENTEISRLLNIHYQNRSKDGECSIVDFDGRSSKNAIISEKARWKEFPIYIDPEYDDFDREQINKAVHRLSVVLPCVKFGIWDKEETPSDYKDTYIHIKKLSGCWSSVGKGKPGKQLMSLGYGCMSVGIILHELLHALGLYHEQSRPDRDDYVTINWENIYSGFENNFKKYSYSEDPTLGVPYNTKSIMHYSSYAFSKNGKRTMVTKKGNTIPYVRKLHQSDITKLRSMYNC